MGKKNNMLKILFIVLIVFLLFRFLKGGMSISLPSFAPIDSFITQMNRLLVPFKAATELTKKFR